MFDGKIIIKIPKCVASNRPMLHPVTALGIPWHPLASLGIPWDPLGSLGIPWVTGHDGRPTVRLDVHLGEKVLRLDGHPQW
jgi:hypothetical protein